MNSWINLHALWQIVGLSLLAGAGLPALFAIGLRALSMPGKRAQPVAVGESEHVYGGNPAGLTAAVICFALVLAAIGWGIYAIVISSR